MVFGWNGQEDGCAAALLDFMMNEKSQNQING